MIDIERVTDNGDLCGECPVWDAERQTLWWTDCAGRKFYCYEPAARTSKLIRRNLEINGFALCRAGGFAVTNNSGIWYWDGKGDPRLIASEAAGRRLQMNDCIADPKGRLLAGSWFYDPKKPYLPGALICVDKNGCVRVLDEGFHLSNGLGFSPDLKTLYFTDSATRSIFAYDYNAESGSANNRRVFVQVPTSEGLPDGLTVDAEGFVWSAQWYGSSVVRYDPDGKAERRIRTPAKQTSSVAFGGPDLTDIFVTSAAKSEPMPIMPPGYDPDNGCFGGALYRLNLGIPGKLEFKIDIRLP